ncbi:hypothetical protein C2I06_21235 [Niallia circulans]|uniref:hypothetical protein n=1 Tax=Niallia circulans TaxID=1397 RepID=UPI00030F8587|nr:hypothetical protein [Niallia circulans]AYV69165.1 hypothetical protein C2I06_21235 [Niallia circulans]
MTGFLDVKICEDFRESINKTDIFIYDNEYKEHYNLFCAVMDRMDSSISYLNRNANPPKSEEELLFFIMYTCMVLDAVKQLLKSLDIENVYSDKDNAVSYKFFKDICVAPPLNIPQEDCPTDDKFFEYIRSLSMAHPFETNRPKFFKKGEIQYSPLVIANSNFMSARGIKDGVGIRIYSNKFEEVQDLLFPFSLLKEYINSRFLLIKKATEKVYQIIDNKEKIWRKVKVPRNLSPTITLEYILEILKSRYENTYYVELGIKCLSCEITEMANKDIVSSYKKIITNLIPCLIEAVEELDYEKMATALDNVLSARPKNIHEMGHYQLEKIFGYLHVGNESSSEYKWGLQQAQHFANEFAVKWVKINIDNMNADEIKLLVRIACYFEKKEEGNF